MIPRLALLILLLPLSLLGAGCGYLQPTPAPAPLAPPPTSTASAPAAEPASVTEEPAEPEPSAEKDYSQYYTRKTPSRDGIGKVYMGREISHVMGHQGIRWLERPEREREELPNRVVEEMELAPDAVVADIGAGSGYFTFRIAPKVPEGKVLAVDIQPEMIAVLEQRMKEQGVENVETVLGKIDNPNLQPNSIDAVLFVDAYHEFSHPREMMDHIVAALRPGGRVIQIEYRGEDKELAIYPLHKMTQEQAKKEMAAVGLEWVATKDFLPSQHFFVFRKPEDGGE